LQILNWCTNNKELSNVLELGCNIIYQLYDSNKMVNQVRIHRYGDNLDLEASAVPPSSCLLKLPALGAHVWLRVAVGHTRRRAKVLHSFPSILRSPQQNRVLAQRGTQRKLVKGEALATSIHNPGPGRLSEPERSHLHCWYLIDPLVVSHGAHYHSNLILLALHEVDEAAERERRAVGLAHEEPLQDHSVEVALGPPNKEAVQLDEELEVDIVGLGRGALGLLVPAAGD